MRVSDLRFSSEREKDRGGAFATGSSQISLRNQGVLRRIEAAVRSQPIFTITARIGIRITGYLGFDGTRFVTTRYSYETLRWRPECRMLVADQATCRHRLITELFQTQQNRHWFTEDLLPATIAGIESGRRPVAEGFFVERRSTSSAVDTEFQQNKRPDGNSYSLGRWNQRAGGRLPWPRLGVIYEADSTTGAMSTARAGRSPGMTARNVLYQNGTSSSSSATWSRRRRSRPRSTTTRGTGSIIRRSNRARYRSAAHPVSRQPESCVNDPADQPAPANYEE